MNGRVALKDGKVTGEQAGRVLTRDAHMPSRPMSQGTTRLSVQGAVRNDRIVVDLSQPVNAPRARGTIRITDATAGEVLEATDVGVL